MIYNDADHNHPIIEDGVNVLTVRVADGFLMNGAVALADPATAFGAARSGGGYCFGLAGYGEMIWIASNVGATDYFIAMRETGGIWNDKTGDFNTCHWRMGGTGWRSLPIARDMLDLI